MATMVRSRVRVLFRTPIWQLLSDPRKKLNEIMLELFKLRRNLATLGRAPQHPLAEPLYELVHLLDVVSRWHDRGLQAEIAPFSAVNYGQWDEVIRILCQLEEHFRRAGRDPYGMNRTDKGERVTAEKVFLGNVHGLFTHSVPFWVARRNVHPDFPNANAYDMVCAQSRRFMTSHTGPMIKLIDELESLTR